MTDGPQYDFSGQTAIVTGGARGIGRAVAEHFLRSGAQVWIWDIDPVELNGAHSLSVDVANARQITEALASTVRHFTHHWSMFETVPRASANNPYVLRFGMAIQNEIVVCGVFILANPAFQQRGAGHRWEAHAQIGTRRV